MSQRAKNPIGIFVSFIIILISGISLVVNALLNINLFMQFPHVLLRSLLLFIAAIVLLLGISYIFLGIALFKRKFWAWYLTCAFCILIFLRPLVDLSLFGAGSLNFTTIGIRTGVAVLFLIYFMHPEIKEVFSIKSNRFKIKSLYGAILLVWVFFTLFVSSFSMGYRYISSMGDKPNVLDRPGLEISEVSKDKKGFRRKEIAGFSTLVPDSFISLESEWGGADSVIMKEESGKSDSFIIIDAKSDVFFATSFYEQLGFSSTYGFERALYEEKYGLLLMIYRDFMYAGKNTEISEFDHPEVKGFTRMGIKDNNVSVTIYDKDGRDVGYMRFVGKIASSEDVFTMISSLKLI